MVLVLFICAWNCVKLKFCRFLYGISVSQCILNAILVGFCSAWGLKSAPNTLFFYFIFSMFSLIFLLLSSIVYFRIFLMLLFLLGVSASSHHKENCIQFFDIKTGLKDILIIEGIIGRSASGPPLSPLKLPQSPTALWVVIPTMSMVPLPWAWSSMSLPWKGSGNCARHRALRINFPLPFLGARAAWGWCSVPQSKGRVVPGRRNALMCVLWDVLQRKLCCAVASLFQVHSVAVPCVICAGELEEAGL